jgi:imidazolonepropionase-like amidohydrolase
VFTVFALPFTSRDLETGDTNESTDPNTGNVWAEHSITVQDPSFARALAGGVTTLQILPGSSNLVGGRSVIVKNVPATTVQAMKFPGAAYGMKMACGENPKNNYGAKDASVDAHGQRRACARRSPMRRLTGRSGSTTSPARRTNGPTTI